MAHRFEHRSRGRRIAIATGALAAMIASAGCRDAADDLESIRERACACKDARCAEEIERALAAVAKQKPPRDPDRAARIAAEIERCLVAATAAHEPDAAAATDVATPDR